jgi:hypothetical protein
MVATEVEDFLQVLHLCGAHACGLQKFDRIAVCFHALFCKVIGSKNARNIMRTGFTLHYKVKLARKISARC